MAAIITRLQQNIDDKIKELSQTKNDLQERVELVDRLEESLMNMVSGSGSTAQERRNVKTLDLKESLEQHHEQIRAFETAIAQLEIEIAEYEDQKRDWERRHG